MARERDAAGYLRRALPGALVQRMETFAGLGVPDIYFQHPRLAGWVEAKVATVARRKGTARVPRGRLRPAQAAWLEKLTRAGGRGFIGILADGSFYVVPWELDLWRRLGEGVDLAELRLKNRLNSYG